MNKNVLGCAKGVESLVSEQEYYANERYYGSGLNYGEYVTVITEHTCICAAQAKEQCCRSCSVLHCPDRQCEHKTKTMCDFHPDRVCVVADVPCDLCNGGSYYEPTEPVDRKQWAIVVTKPMSSKYIHESFYGTFDELEEYLMENRLTMHGFDTL